MLDEPTNDLDIESLELLEAALQHYDGTLLLVSHDRAFLDNVVAQTLVAEGSGVWRESSGVIRTGSLQRPVRDREEASSKTGVPAKAATSRTPRVKLSYREQRELTTLPTAIEALENEQRAISERMSHTDYHREHPGQVKADRLRIEEIEHEIGAKFEKWSALEARSRVNLL